MKLSAAARYFDRSVFTDAYGTARFKAQIEPLDYYKIDGATVKRRILSTAPSVTLPARKTLSIEGQVFITGDVAVDYWDGRPLRHRYVLQGADDLATIYTFVQLLAGADGVSAYTSKVWSKYGTDERSSSDYVDEYHLFFAPSEPLAEEHVVDCDGDLYLVLGAHKAQSGLVDGVAHLLESDALSAATFTQRTYDPIMDTNVEVDTSVQCVRVRWQERFKHLSMASTDYERGDSTVVILDGAAAVKAGDRITLSDGEQRVVSVQTRNGCHNLHVRRK